jgi:hypothetical protein
MSCSCQSLAGRHPDLLREWDWGENAIDPHTVRLRSGRQAAWKCVRCGHSWRTSIVKRTWAGTACPACVDRVSRGGAPLLQIARPDLVCEDVEVVDGTAQESLTCGSVRRAVWTCLRPGCRPDGCPHPRTWEAPVSARGKQRARPYCQGGKVCPCNSLRAKYPEVASQWDHSRHEVSPDEVASGSHRAVWWRAADESGVYVWKASVKDRIMAYRRSKRLSKARARLVQR